MLKNLIRKFPKLILLGLIGTIVATGLLVLVNLIPTQRILDHVKTSLDTILPDEESRAQGGIVGYISNGTEAFTDAIMVQNAFDRIEGKNAFEHAMWVYHKNLGAEYWTPEESIRYICEGNDTSDMDILEYSRYWHGYLVLLKPLIYLFDLKVVRVLSVLAQILLCLAIVAVSVIKKEYSVPLATAIGLSFMKPLLMASSFTMSICSLLILTAILIIVCLNGKLTKKGLYTEFFLILGMCVSYFDFLTYPAAVFGFPIAAVILLSKESDLKKKFFNFFEYGLVWCLGYVALWAMKWIIAEVTLRSGTIRSAVSSTVGWTDSIGSLPWGTGAVFTLKEAFSQYKSVYYLIAIAALVIVSVIFTVLDIKLKAAKELKRNLIFIPLFFVPFLWFVLVQHHSAMHVFFTFRILGVAGIAMAGYALSCIKIYLKGRHAYKAGSPMEN